MKRPLTLQTKARIIRYAIILAVLVAWELLPRLGLVPRLLLPSLSSSVTALFEQRELFSHHLLVTLREVALSFLFACCGGIAVGLFVGRSQQLSRATLPVFSALFAVPLVILYPLFTAWFGIGSTSKIVFASVYGFLPTMLSTAAGVQTIDPALTRVSRSLAATPLQEVIWVFLPATIPAVLAAFRLGGALVIVGVVVAEMMTSSAGIGFLLSKFRTTLDSPGVFASIIIVLGLAVFFDVIVQVLERRWRAGQGSRSMPIAANA